MQRTNFPLGINKSVYLFIYYLFTFLLQFYPHIVLLYIGAAFAFLLF